MSSYCKTFFDSLSNEFSESAIFAIADYDVSKDLFEFLKIDMVPMFKIFSLGKEIGSLLGTEKELLKAAVMEALRTSRQSISATTTASEGISAESSRLLVNAMASYQTAEYESAVNHFSLILSQNESFPVDFQVVVRVYRCMANIFCEKFEDAFKDVTEVVIRDDLETISPEMSIIIAIAHSRMCILRMAVNPADGPTTVADIRNAAMHLRQLVDVNLNSALLLVSILTPSSF
jgi:hypothetical protein